MGQSWDNHGTLIGQSWANHGTIMGQSWGESMLVDVRMCVLLPVGCGAGGRSCGTVQQSHEGRTRLPGTTVDSQWYTCTRTPHSSPQARRLCVLVCVLQAQFGDGVHFNGRLEGSERIPNTCNVSLVGEGLQSTLVWCGVCECVCVCVCVCVCT